MASKVRDCSPKITIDNESMIIENIEMVVSFIIFI